MGKNPLSAIPSVDEMLGRIKAARERIENDEELQKELTEGRPSGNPITLGPRLPTAEEWAELQIAGAKANASKWLKRTLHPKKNFKEEALKPDAVERFKESMRKVIDEDRHAGGMALVNESEAMAIIEKRGASAYSQGVADREPKIKRVVKDLHADRMALALEIDGLDTATDADREAKMIANVRGLKAIGKKRRGG